MHKYNLRGKDIRMQTRKLVFLSNAFVTQMYHLVRRESAFKYWRITIRWGSGRTCRSNASERRFAAWKSCPIDDYVRWHHLNLILKSLLMLLWDSQRSMRNSCCTAMNAIRISDGGYSHTMNSTESRRLLHYLASMILRYEPIWKGKMSDTAHFLFDNHFFQHFQQQ